MRNSDSEIEIHFCPIELCEWNVCKILVNHKSYRNVSAHVLSANTPHKNIYACILFYSIGLAKAQSVKQMAITKRIQCQSKCVPETVEVEIEIETQPLT